MEKHRQTIFMGLSVCVAYRRTWVYLIVGKVKLQEIVEGVNKIKRSFLFI